MEWIAENWFLIVVILLFAAMHMFGHGHGGHRKANKDPNNKHTQGLGGQETQAQADENKHQHH